MKDISIILRSLGFLESEAKTYLAGLERGPQTASELSTATELSRQATYTAIEALRERGLMTELEREGVRTFNAERPEKLLAYAKRREAEMAERINDLERELPELELRASGNRPIVRMYEGKEGIRAIIEGVGKNAGGFIEELTDSDALYRMFSREDIHPVKAEATAKNMRVRGLYASHNPETYPQPKGFPVTRYWLPSGMNGFNSQIQLMGDLVIFTTFTGKLNAIVIESKEIMNAMRTLFELSARSLDAMGCREPEDGQTE